jgi:hypothetical protein
METYTKQPLTLKFLLEQRMSELRTQQLIIQNEQLLMALFIQLFMLQIFVA